MTKIENKTIQPHSFILSLITRTINNTSKEVLLTETILTNHDIHNDFKNYDFTYDEKISISKNAQKTLTFSMSRKLMRGYEWITNPFIKAIKIGSILKLEDRFGNHHFFTVTNISFEPSAANMSFKYQCKDSFSYQLTRQNDGYSIINDISSADYIGSRTIDFWANKIKEECYITDEYLPLTESLLLISNGTTSSLVKKSNYVAATGNKVKLIKPSFVVTTVDQSYVDMHLQIPFALSGATANSALISLADQYGLMLQTAERLEKINNKLQIKRYFWFEPTKNNQISGLKYSPEKNINSFNFSLEGNSLTTVLNIEPKERADGELISMLPPISPFFKQYFSSSDWKKENKYYPGMYTDIVNGKIFKTQYTNTDYSTEVDATGTCVILTFDQLASNAKNEIFDLITDPFYNKINFTINNESDSFLTIENSLHYARASRYEFKIAYNETTILWNEDRNLTQEQKNNIRDAGLGNISIQLIVYTNTNLNTVNSVDLNILLTYDFTQEDIEFAKFADESPWLENKIIDFNYFLKTKVLTQIEYNTLMDKINNDLRVVNGKILYWSSAYYEALKKSADTTAKILSQIDSLSAHFNSEIIIPYANGRTPQSNNSFQKLYNEMWERSIDKTELFNLDDYQVEYANKYILAEQTFLKALYNFRKVFNAPYSNTTTTIYRYNLIPKNNIYPIYLEEPKYRLYTNEDNSSIAYKKQEDTYIECVVIDENTTGVFTKQWDLEKSYLANHKYDPKKTYGVLKNSVLTEINNETIAKWIISTNINKFNTRNMDTMSDLSSIQNTDVLKYFSPHILPRTTPYSYQSMKTLKQLDLFATRGKKWENDWVDYWRSYKANIPIKEVECIIDNKKHTIKFVGQDLFTSQNAIGFSYNTFIEQLKTAESATAFPYYRRDGQNPFSVTNDSEFFCFIDGSDVSNIGDKIEVLNATNNADISDAYYPAYFVSSSAANEYNKITKDETKDKYWDTSILDKIALTFSSKPNINGAPLKFKDSYFKVLSINDKMYKNKTYRRIYVDPNINNYFGEYKNTVWGEEVLKLIGTTHSQIKFYPLIAWSVAETEHLKTEEDEITPSWSTSGKFFTEDGEYFLIIELVDYKEEPLTDSKLNSLTYPYDVYYSETIINNSESNLKGTKFKLEDCVVSLNGSNFYVVIEAGDYIAYNKDDGLDDNKTYFMQKNEEYVRVYTKNQAISEELYIFEADKTKGSINFSEISVGNLNYQPKSIDLTYYNNVFERKTAKLTWDTNAECYTGKVLILENNIEQEKDMFFITEVEEVSFSNLTNGQVWYNYHDKINETSLFEIAAAIEVDLSTYWTEARNASILCRYFIPDNWQPTIEGTPNGFANELYFRDDTSTPKNIVLNNAYIPEITIVKNSNGSTLLPRLTLTKVKNEGFELKTKINSNEALRTSCNYLFNGDLSDWYVTEDGTKTYYTISNGGVMWKDLVTHLYGLAGYSNFSGHYDMMFKYFSTFYSHMSFESYENLITEKQNLWRDLYNVYPSILLESKFSNENAMSSEELLQMAKLYFKDLSQPEKNYNISLIDTSLLDGYKGQEIKIGDAIQIQIEDYYDDLDDIYEILSQFLFITDLNYSLRQNNISVTVNSIKYQEKLLQSLVKLIR